MSSNLYRKSIDDADEVLHIKEFTPEMIFPSTNQMCDKESWGTKMLVLGRPNCFEKGTKVLLYNGKIKLVEDVVIGDIVMGDDSTPRTVLSLSKGHSLLYKIVPKIGEPVVVNGNHIITIVKTKGNNKGQIIDISVEEYIKMPLKLKTNFNWIRVPVEFPKIIQKIDPYIIGYFIDGDYSFIKREFIKKHFSHTTDNIIDKLIEKNIPQIPNFIMYSAIEDRAQYLAGMLDAKATYNATTKRFDIPLPSEELCEQVMYLAGSIGYYNSKIKNFKSNFFTQTQQVMWSCYIYVNTNTDLPSKIFDINYIKTVFGGMFTTNFYITESIPGDFYGFAVDGNHRFLLGDFSITHNSGKCMGENTPVLMYDGSVKMIQHVQLNDLLMGDDSTPRRVLELYSGIDDMFKIHQTKGDTYVVNSEHILVVKEGPTIKDIALRDVDTNSQFGIKAKILYRRQDTPEDPYMYGCKLQTILEDVYILNDIDTRLQVLAGYLDVHGIYNNDMHTYQFTVPIDLYAKFILLVRTLGFNMTTNKHGLSTLYGRVETIPCEIHAPRTVKRRRTDHLKSRIKIEYLNKGIYYGFELDGNCRYVLGDCTVTHNTYAIKSLLYQKRHIFPVGMIFSGSAEASGQWKNLFPETFIYDKLKTDKLIAFEERQKLAIKYSLPNPWAVMLLDDMGFDGKVLKNEIVKKLLYNGRHLKMWFILALQHPTDVGPGIRTCIDYVFIFQNNNMTERKKIYDNYASIIPSFQKFCDIMNGMVENYTALVINQLITSNDYQDCIFWYKATPFPSDFKFGSNDFWNHHYVRYNDE
jgi:hypothetical protein